MTKWALGQAPLLVQNEPERRDDDAIVTPRGQDPDSVFDIPRQDGEEPAITMFSHYQRNPDTLVYQREYEENEAVSYLFCIFLLIFIFYSRLLKLILTFLL